MSYFNVRVYGLLINNQQEILISDEKQGDTEFSKFPGGGLELGEGLKDALKREFMEECGAEIEVINHFYTTDFFEKSSFNDSQVLSIYYFVKPLTPLDFPVKKSPFDFDAGSSQSFRWTNLSSLTEDDVTFRTDKAVVKLLKEQIDF